MKKVFKTILITLLVGIIGLVILNKTEKGSIRFKHGRINADATIEKTYNINNWQELKENIENSEETNITVQLKQGTWIADSCITISERKECYYNSRR